MSEKKRLRLKLLGKTNFRHEFLKISSIRIFYLFEKHFYNTLKNEQNLLSLI